MRKNLNLGKFLNRNITPVCLYTGAMACVIFFPPHRGNYLTLQLGGITLFTTTFWGYLNYQHAQDRLFKDLFKEFNERYDKFNEHYDRIKEYENGVLPKSTEKEDKKIIVDYLNLCAEEFFWFEKSRIEESAWKSWESGMETWAKVPAVRAVFYQEVASWTSSYYTGFQDFFKKIIEKN